MRLKDKVIIITGSTTGIGKAIAVYCAREGARIVVHGRDREKGEKVVVEIGTDRSALYIGDLQGLNTPKELVDFALKSFGRLDGIVNNAARVVNSDIHTTDAAFLHEVLSINTVAPFLLIQAALPFLHESGGRVLNIGSVNAYSGEPNLLAYSMSKGAMMTMTRNLGDVLMREYNVRVNQINPGWVLTENEIAKKRRDGLSDNWYEDLPDVYAPAGRILKPEEIAAAAVYWLGDESGPVSGQVFELEQYPFIGRNPPKDSSTIQINK